MSLIKCSECGNSVSDKASACPHCGCPLQKSNIFVGQLPEIGVKPPVSDGKKQSKFSPTVFIAVLTVILMASVVIMGACLENSESYARNSSSLSPEARIIAQISPTLEKVGIDADNVSYVERVGDWAYGQRYSIHYEGKTFLIYLNQNGSVNSINRGNIKLYDNGVVKQRVY